MEMFAQRARELVAQMTLEEKVSQMRYDAPAIERLGIPAYSTIGGMSACMVWDAVEQQPFSRSQSEWRPALMNL